MSQSHEPQSHSPQNQVSENYVLAIQARLAKFPFGGWLFSKVIAARAPYFKSIKPRIVQLEENFCQVGFKKSKAVHNHIGTVHVIAICNALEMAMGVMAEASVPKHLRWLPKGMTVDYQAKASTDIVAEARLQSEDWKVGDVMVPVVARDTAGTIVVEGRIKLWITEKK